MYSSLFRLFGPWVSLDIYCIENDSFDRAVFAELMEQSEVLRLLEAQVHAFYPTVGPLLQDIFSAFYKYNVILKEEEEIRPGYFVNREILESLLESKEYEELKSFTLLDELSAAVGTLGFCQTLAAELLEHASDIEDLIEEMNLDEEVVEQIDQLQSEIDLAGMSPASDLKKRLQVQAKDTAANIEATSRRIEQLKQQQNRQAAQQSIRRAAEEAANRAVSRVRDLSDFVAEWGTQRGASQALPLAKRLELAAQLSASQKMRKLAKMVGRLKRIALSREQQKLQHQPDEIYDVSLGHDLARLIPYEMMQLTHPVLRSEFKRRFVEGKLLQYSLEGVDKSGKGPMIVCIDGSYSMEGDKELWAKAVALAFFSIARRKRRSFVAIQFGSKDDALLISKFPKRERELDLKKMVLMAEHFIGGGTDFEKPLSAAIRYMEEEEEFSSGDIVFITDGDCNVSQGWLNEFIDKKEEMGFMIYTVLVDMGRTTPATVNRFSDRISRVSNLSDSEARDLFEMVVKR
jgi:uncharacterized protein with von Willebrand factor type A (vWA) domain